MALQGLCDLAPTLDQINPQPRGKPLGPAPIDVYLDRGMVMNILRNLLSNAIKYSPTGARIQLDCTASKDQVYIVVSDRGIGIPADDHQHLFGRFFRARNAGSVQGTGLGLHIVQRYVELMSGSIIHEAREGGGSVFTVLLRRRIQR